MSETNVTETTEAKPGEDFANMKYQDLYAHAKELGIPTRSGMKKEELIDLILGRTASSETVAAEVQKKQDRVVLTIHESSDKNAPNPVFVGVNGIGYSIKRGVPVEVPRAVVNVLANAKQTVYEAKSTESGGLQMVPREALSYPYTVSE